MDLVVISPHLDDGVFSCGGELARLASEGKRSLVVTCYTRLPEERGGDERWRVFSDYEKRCREDLDSLEVLGAGHRWLGLSERAFRTPRIHPLKIFRSPETIAEFVNLPALRSTVDALYEEFPEARILCPLAVGNHFDHVETFLACFETALERRDFDRTEFYEDAYAMDPGARKAHFVTRRQKSTHRVGWLPPSVGMWLMFGVMALFRGGPSAEEFLGEKSVGIQWEFRPRSIGGFEAKKLEAVSRYDSQVRLMGGAKKLSRVFHRFHSQWGGAEPRWHSRPQATG